MAELKNEDTAMRNNMPEINIDSLGLEGRDREIVEACLNKGKLRATKPKDGEAAYVWRMTAFMVSPISAHQCMPVTADFDMPEKYWDRSNPNSHKERRARCKELDALSDKMVNAIPKQNWHGVRRWGRALGQI